MLPTTLDAVKALLKADPALTPEDRTRIVASVRNHGREVETKRERGPQEKRILPRGEVARRPRAATAGVSRRRKPKAKPQAGRPPA